MVPISEFEPTTFPNLINSSTERRSAHFTPIESKNRSNLMNISEDPIGYSKSSFKNLEQRSNFDCDESFEKDFDDGDCEMFDCDSNPEAYFAHLQPKINAALKRARETGLREILP
jgi:hypothetical protein